VPERGERRLFEMLTLEGAQAGLNWLTILKKRDSYREAFAGFDPEVVARFTMKERDRLLQNPGIVRNRLKVLATITNAKALLAMRDAGEDFSEFVWSFVGGQPIQYRRRGQGSVPSETRQSKEMSMALSKRGFRFVGPTICYAFMQATGMVNDHVVSCFRHAECQG